MAGLTKRKTPVIESVLYSYTGTDDDFNRFLKAVVHDFYTVCPARISQRDVVGSVEDSSA
ncbi:hypothetical protein [Ruthenibacterium lactatiformans]|uniref:hypothetical protein n=1 Tax=Ruthenibacterium lactatiformans TaxID=1550024 RepID=UPI001058B153|nr:hypothetical protein [Ruthenibacterium lactatiformans]